jgi:hypothetical protein
VDLNCRTRVARSARQRTSGVASSLLLRASQHKELNPLTASADIAYLYGQQGKYVRAAGDPRFLSSWQFLQNPKARPVPIDWLPMKTKPTTNTTQDSP